MTQRKCRWWWRWFCRARIVPLYHSWRCEVCGRTVLKDY